MFESSHRCFNLRREALNQLEELALKICSQSFSHQQRVKSFHQLQRRQRRRSAFVRGVDVQEQLVIQISDRSSEFSEISIEHRFRVVEGISAAALQILEEGMKRINKIINTVESALRQRDVRFCEKTHVSEF